ncbi:hypothetical protein FGO68_gene15992 [Halteria grandinella]|uniref:Uncharacterized protein n=1 Tax=Halteria grandinella TaxID=5974 RepID=A0A8J8P7U1_HALGN|nr:hypothetical protein FGO68_gene15992 [Halteria grandinella]
MNDVTIVHFFIVYVFALALLPIIASQSILALPSWLYLFLVLSKDVPSSMSQQFSLRLIVRLLLPKSIIFTTNRQWLLISSAASSSPDHTYKAILPDLLFVSFVPFFPILSLFLNSIVLSRINTRIMLELTNAIHFDAGTSLYGETTQIGLHISLIIIIQ